jgi:hypothetical protein
MAFFKSWKIVMARIKKNPKKHGAKRHEHRSSSIWLGSDTPAWSGSVIALRLRLARRWRFGSIYLSHSMVVHGSI